MDMEATKKNNWNMAEVAEDKSDSFLTRPDFKGGFVSKYFEDRMAKRIKKATAGGSDAKK